MTVGFVPLRKTLPTAMHLLSLQHLDRSNRVGLARRLYRRLMVDRSVRRAELIITNSQFAAGQIRGVFPGCADRLVVSYEGLQHEQFSPAPVPDDGEADARVREEIRRRAGLPAVDEQFLSVQTGPPAAGRLRRAAGNRAGEPPPGDGRRQLAGRRGRRPRAGGDELGIGRDVRFPGWVDDADLAPLYRQARAFVLASREETFGRCVVEAMACGVPCVVHDIPVMREVTGGHALLTDFRDTPAASAALRGGVDRRRPARPAARGGNPAWAGRFSFDQLAAERLDAIRAMLRVHANALTPRRRRRQGIDTPGLPRFPFTFCLLPSAFSMRTAQTRPARGRPVDGAPARLPRDRSAHRPRVGPGAVDPLSRRVHVIGLDAIVVPEFVPQQRLTYWKQELGFTAHPPPDFPHEPGA